MIASEHYPSHPRRSWGLSVFLLRSVHDCDLVSFEKMSVIDMQSEFFSMARSCGCVDGRGTHRAG